MTKIATSLFFLLSLFGCSSTPLPSTVDAVPPTDHGYVQYDITVPYLIRGAMPNGSFGDMYTSMPSAPLAADNFEFTFCVAGGCMVLSYPTQWIPTGESLALAGTFFDYYTNGVLTCDAWDQRSTITWYDGTPTHWHVGINANCVTAQLNIKADFQALYTH